MQTDEVDAARGVKKINVECNGRRGWQRNIMLNRIEDDIRVANICCISVCLCTHERKVEGYSVLMWKTKVSDWG